MKPLLSILLVVAWVAFLIGNHFGYISGFDAPHSVQLPDGRWETLYIEHYKNI